METASDDDHVSLVYVKGIDGKWDIASGTTSWSHVENIVVGWNYIEVRAKDGSNQHSSIVSITVLREEQPEPEPTPVIA